MINNRMLIICGESIVNLLERLICNKMFEFFKNELISFNQSDFKPGDSCITDDICQSFDESRKTKALFLDISKAFDKVWHEGLLYKLKENDISDDLLNIITGFLSLRKERVVLNGRTQHGLTLKQEFPKDLF